MSKLNWDDASAKSKQNKLNQSAETPRARSIARMADGCVKTMLKYPKNRDTPYAELLQKATAWATKKYDAQQT